MKYKTFNKQNEMEALDKPEVTSLSDISIERLIELGLLALDREIRNLTIASSKGKLDAPSAKDLRDHLKLLFELKDREKDYLKTLTDEELSSKLGEIKDEKS